MSVSPVEWKEIDDYARSGKVIWLGVRKFLLGMDTPNVYCDILLCKYDTWIEQFRMLQSGKTVELPQYYIPCYYAECVMPNYQNLKELYTNDKHD